jgi:hypothetical protein
MNINPISWNFKNIFLKIEFLKILLLLAFGSRLHEFITEFSGKFFYSAYIRFLNGKKGFGAISSGLIYYCMVLSQPPSPDTVP